MAAGYRLPVATTSIRIQLNGAPRELPAEGGTTSVAGLLEALDLAGKRVAVELNGDVVPRAEHATRTLGDGDTVEVVTFVGGG